MLRSVFKLYTLFNAGKIKTLPQHEVNPGLDKSSRENYLYFTLPPSINFQRSSPAMWKAALGTFEDSKTKYIFLPEEVVKSSRKRIQFDLMKHKLALQRNKHTDIWIAISMVMHKLFKDDPRELLKMGKWDVLKVQELIRAKQIPYLQGPKMSNYWLYILSHYTDARFTNMQEISIIPDTHVLQSSVKLGLTDQTTSPLVVAKLWKELLAGSGIYPVDMHPVLWNWSRNNFSPNVSD
ncbi:MAG: hypothetical protein UW73_C0001G0009 [Microgenomates group bacterium GW2011_GWB1_44_8]|nr:MAG: hypothetical protein UW73_C0001G0009 [Microgenomates group bacterium GW2011_GWB1_44_8]